MVQDGREYAKNGFFKSKKVHLTSFPKSEPHTARFNPTAAKTDMENTQVKLLREINEGLLNEIVEKNERLAAKDTYLEAYAEAVKLLKEKIAHLEEENKELAQQKMLGEQNNALLEEELGAEKAKVQRLLGEIAAGSGILPQRSMTTGIAREDEGDGAAAAAAAGGGPSVARTTSSHGVSTSNAWIVKEIPPLYPSYNSSAGPINYWKQLEDGTYIWEPTSIYEKEEDGAAAAAGGGPSRGDYGSFYPEEQD